MKKINVEHATLWAANCRDIKAVKEVYAATSKKLAELLELRPKARCVADTVAKATAYPSNSTNYTVNVRAILSFVSEVTLGKLLPADASAADRAKADAGFFDLVKINAVLVARLAKTAK